MSYAGEAARLDDTVLAAIAVWREGATALGDAKFNALALEILAHQLRYNAPYARYCATFGISERTLPAAWSDIPAIPAAAYKEAALCTFDLRRAELVFETSGTTPGVGGKHYMERRALYDAALLAGFERFMLRGTKVRLRYLMLVPNPDQRPHSSLGYMMGKVGRTFGDGDTRWYLDNESLHTERFLDEAATLAQAGLPLCVAGTAFAFAEILSAASKRGLSGLPLPPGSRIMETGGFKGRSRVIGRDAFYRDLMQLFALPATRIVAEYGMTELTSQYYDDVSATAPGDAVVTRVKAGPPWMRPLVVDAAGKAVKDGVVGSLVHVDLANRSTCVAIATEDLGARLPGGIVLLGREEGAELRGCSLDAEALAERVRAS